MLSFIWYNCIVHWEDEGLLIAAHPIADSSLFAAIVSVIATGKSIFSKSLNPLESSTICLLFVFIILNFLMTLDDKRILKRKYIQLNNRLRLIENHLNIKYNNGSSNMSEHHFFYKHYVKKQLRDEITKRAVELSKGHQLKDNGEKNSLNHQINCEAKKLDLYELHHMESKFHE